MADTISQKMTNVKKVIDKLSKKLETEPIYTPYIKFEINGLTVLTVSQENYQNIAVSLANKKNGSGEANTFTLVIAYSPSFNDGFDPNALEESLMSINKSGNLRRLECKLTYGYADTDLKTTTYTGLLLNYEMDCQDGSLVYTLTGYSGLSRLIESKDPIVIDSSLYDTDGKVQPTKVAQWLIETKMKDSEGTSSISYKASSGMIRGENVIGSDEPIQLASQLDKNPMKALTDILNKATHRSQYSQLNIDAENNTAGNSVLGTSKITYGWYVNDAVTTETGPEVFIYADDPAEEADQQDAFTFNWNAPVNENGSLVLSFKPSFNGQALISLWDSANAAKTSTLDEDATEDQLSGTGSFFVANDGSLKVAPDTEVPVSGGDIESVVCNIEQAKSTWIQAVQYPYKATLTTIGIPCEIPLTGIIQINALIGYNDNTAVRAHHSSGKYMVQGVEDLINQGGFTTTWDLLKVESVASSNSDQYENTNGQLPVEDTEPSSVVESSNSSSTSGFSKFLQTVGLLEDD